MNSQVQQQPNDLEQLFGAIRTFMARHYPNKELSDVHLNCTDGRRLILLPTQMRPDLAPLDPPRCAHSPDFRSVNWFGRTYTFSKSQARVVEVLWSGYFDCTPDVAQETLLAVARSSGTRLIDLFRNHEAWGKMIVVGETSGSYRLAPPTAEQQSRDDAV